MFLNQIKEEYRGISIHALREEGDQITRVTVTQTRAISIHALREEGDARKPEAE